MKSRSRFSDLLLDFFLTNIPNRNMINSLFKEQIYFSKGDSSRIIQTNTNLQGKEEFREKSAIFYIFVGKS